MKSLLLPAKEDVVYHAGPFWFGRAMGRGAALTTDEIGFDPKQRARRRRRSKVARASRKANR